MRVSVWPKASGSRSSRKKIVTAAVAAPALVATLLAPAAGADGKGDEVAEAVAASPHARSMSCDELKGKMDAIGYKGAKGSSALGLSYLAYYVAAKIKGCSFLEGYNRSHVDPESGIPFQLQRAAKSDEKRGPKIYVDNDTGFWFLNELPTKGSYNSKKDIVTLFRFLPAGETIGGRTAYFVVAESGRRAGKCVSYDTYARMLQATDCVDYDGNPLPKDRFTIGPQNWGRAIDVFTPDHKFRGVVDHVGNTHVSIWAKWHGGWNQRWQFRPANYSDGMGG